MGMVNMSRPESGFPLRKGVIALWKDSHGYQEEIVLPEDASAVVLSLSLVKDNGFTLDGRSVKNEARTPVLAGIHPIVI